ncbi:MAG: RidA family protein [bacterium]
MDESRTLQTIFTKNAPKPAGHYSQAIVHHNVVYISGQLPIDPETGEKHLSSIEEQTELAIRNLLAVVEAAGSDKNHILKTTVYVADIDLWDRVDQIYGECFGDHRPARAVVPTKDLHFGFKIEIDAIAAVK